MGTWCTEGVKRSRIEHQREDDDRDRRIYNQRKAKHEDKGGAKGICSKCGQKIIKKRKKDG